MKNQQIDENGSSDTKIGEIRSEQGRVTTEDLHEIQSRICSVEESIEIIRLALKKEESGHVTFVPDPDHPLTILTNKKEALLADIALGVEVSEEDLRSINEAILEEEKIVSSLIDSSVEKSHTISGLKARLAHFQNELSQARRQHLEFFNIFMQQELEAACERYVTLADGIASQFMRIRSIDSILERCGLPRQLYSNGGKELMIPLLNVTICRHHRCFGDGKYHFREDYADDKSALQQANDKLKSAGIDVPQRITETD